MSFNSVIFIYFFLPITVGVHWLFNKAAPCLQNLWLLITSLVFYGWCDTKALAFLLIFGLANYVFGWLVSVSSRMKSVAVKRLVMAIVVAANVMALYFVKYLNFTIDITNSLLNKSIPKVTSLIVPLGISFLVFSTISYLVDVYWGRVKPLNNIIHYFLYVSFFPKVSQGPITRCGQMQDELLKRSVTIEALSSGLRRFCFGLTKKVLIADILGASVDLIFTNLDGGIYTATAWAGMLCYTFQIYFDFSGYTDMAIGIGSMLGFTLPENFNGPYLSKSISEFWRRWHMTLGSWFREYIYIPLGGNRKGLARTLINLSVVWMVTGLWHGANYTYIAWGVSMGVMVIVERFIGKAKWYTAIPSFFKWAFTFLFVMLSWVVFRSSDIQSAGSYLAALFGSVDADNVIYGTRYYMDNGTILALGAGILLSLPFPESWKSWMKSSASGAALQNVLALIVFIVALVFMVNSTYNAFIYFQF